MEGESGVTPSIIDDLHSLDIQGDQMEGKSGGTQCIIEEIHSWDIQGHQVEGERMVLLEVSLLNLIPILGMSKEIKWMVKAWCYSKYH